MIELDRLTKHYGAHVAVAELSLTVAEGELLVGGTADERVAPQRVQDLFRRLCTTGQATQLIMLDGADHGTEVPRALPQIGRWLTARFDGAAATDDCS